MLADGGANFAKAIGHEFDTKDFGGIRLKRLAMLVKVTPSCYLAENAWVSCLVLVR